MLSQDMELRFKDGNVTIFKVFHLQDVISLVAPFFSSHFPISFKLFILV